MSEHNDLRRSLTAFEQNSTLIAVIEISLSSWLVAGIVPGLDRHPLKKMGPDQEALLRLLQRWREEAFKAGRMISGLLSPTRLAGEVSSIFRTLVWAERRPALA